MNEPDDSEFLSDREIVVTDMLRFPKMLLWTAVTYIGIAIAVFPFVDLQDQTLEVLKKVGLPLVGLLVVVFSTSFLRAEIRKRRIHTTERFVDVDERNRKEVLNDLAATRAALLKGAIADASEVVAEKDEKSVQAGRAQEVVHDQTFSIYFNSIREVLERKAAVADEKASILLDKGVAYSRFGILVFVASIVVWQFLSWQNGFKVQHIYGIASCSVLFIFIEFLSAWFLKQYRHFVDTSTYLIKVKSIFDRYMLSYHVANEFDMLEPEERVSSQMGALLELIRDDIKWPDDYLYKNPDVSFARETLQSISEIVRAARKSGQRK